MRSIGGYAIVDEAMSRGVAVRFKNITFHIGRRDRLDIVGLAHPERYAGQRISRPTSSSCI
jgi:hypothetical protein